MAFEVLKGIFKSAGAPLNSLQDLFVCELRDIYNAENQILKALPKMEQAATNQELKDAFRQHEQQTRGHVQRLEQIFRTLNLSPKGEGCEGMEGLIDEGQELLWTKATGEVKNAGLICCAQKVEHYEIAAYGTLRTWARQLGHQEAARLLEQTLNEEKSTDQTLNRIAESAVNLQASGVGAGLL
jgi:ferritin-like metal-binding protein YciE